MRVFLYILIAVMLLLLGVVGLRGLSWTHEPLRIFDDMAWQDRINPQQEPVMDVPPGTVPVGLAGETGQTGIPEKIVFTSRGGSYFETGVWDGYYGQGLPKEMIPKDRPEALALLERGKTQFNNYCAVCHGASGNGKGTAASYPGFPVLVDLNDEMYRKDRYPDGRLFFVITNGLGNMDPYGAAIPVRERWPVVAYLRALQRARTEGGEGVADAQ